MLEKLRERERVRFTMSFLYLQVLDGTTLCNLSILNDSSGENDGTLLQKLDLCCTPFGKR
jgi:DNA mismatch repair ATPase MutS